MRQKKRGSCAVPALQKREKGLFSKMKKQQKAEDVLFVSKKLLIRKEEMRWRQKRKIRPVVLVLLKK